MGEGRGAYFANPTGIENILTRVTGSNASNILGRLGVLGGANLFLLNPNGIVFGPNASLDIQGSFVATTADRIKLGDSDYFSAVEQQRSSLLSVSPGALFFSQVANQPTAIINQGNLSTPKHLILSAGNLDLQGQLQAGGDLKLQAQDRVKVRDSVTTPFLAQAGGNLIIGGNQGIDILALNHPTLTSFVSGGDFSLISDGIISGDARFASGGNFSLTSVLGELANFVSKYDSIISSNGNVDVAANYKGASLLVESKGNIRFGGEINITQPATGSLNGLDTLSLSNSSALILRSGQNTLVYGDNTLRNAPASSSLDIPQGITLSKDVVLQSVNGVGGSVNLDAGKGDITTHLISTNGQKILVSDLVNSYAGLNALNDNTIGSFSTDTEIFFYPPIYGGGITLNAANGSISTGNLLSYSSSSTDAAGNGGVIALDAAGNISTQSLYSFSVSSSNTAGNGGAVKLSTNGIINTQDLVSYSVSTNSKAGDGGAITLTAGDYINTGNLLSRSYSSLSYNNLIIGIGSAGNGGAITLTAGDYINTGNLFSSSQTENPSIVGNGGAITLTAGDYIDTGNLSSGSITFSDTGGNGGAITLTAGNYINTEDLFSGSISFSDTEGNGGAITLSTKANINTQNINSSSSSSSGTAGKGGAITLSATDAINLTSINSSGGKDSGNITIINRNAPFNLNNGVISSDTFAYGKAGDIKISAASISLTNGAQLSASTHSTGVGGNITLDATDTVELSGETTNTPIGLSFSQESSNITGFPPDKYFGGYIPNGTIDNIRFSGSVFPSGVFCQTTVDSTGSAGNLKIETGKLIINNGAAIATTTFGKNSNAGDISIRASDSIKIDSGSILSGVAPNAIGNSGKVEMSTSSLELINSGIVQTQTLGEGVAGNIVVDADTVSISNKGSALRSASGGINELLTGTSSSSKIGQGGNINVTANNLRATDGAVLDATTVTNSTGGDITASANTLSVDKGGQILTSTSGTGDAGSITVNATQIQLSDLESGLLAQTTSAGKAGNLTIQPHGDGQSLRVSFQKGAQISASTSGNGQGGNLSVKAPQAVTINGNGHLSVETTGAGKAGDVTLTTDTLNINNGATVSATATANAMTSEPSGSISVNANQVNLSGTGSGLLAETQGAADAGSLILQPSNNGQSLTVNLQDNAQISASTSSSGQGGNLFVTAPQAVTIKGNGQLSVETTGAGVAGSLTIDTQRLTIQDRAQVSASTSSPNSNGVGGNITVNAAQSLDLSNGASLLAESNGAAPAGKVTINTGNLTARNGTIATSSKESSGGGITITASDIRLYDDSDIRTNVAFGAGGGGNINLTANSIIAFGDSDILAYADRNDGGRGGNITFETPAFFGENYSPASSGNDPPNTLDGNNRVDINATGAVSGIITIPDVSFIQNSLTELPENQINTDSLLANSCIVRRNQPTRGSFTITGTGGLPQRPGDAQMSSFPTVDVKTLPTDSTLSNTNPNSSWQKSDPIVEPLGVYRLPNGKLVLSRECS